LAHEKHATGSLDCGEASVGGGRFGAAVHGSS
jgi:hypothetical protein